jgi:hypothetical protein
MCKRIFLSAATTAAVLLGGASAKCQTLISSFEDNLSSSVGATWEGTGIANSEFVTVGATNGTKALAIHHQPGWSIQAILKGGLQLAQAVAAHDFLVIDVTTTDNGVAGDLWSPAWRQIIPVFNSNQGGWQQSQIDYPVAADDGGTLTSTVILDLNTVANTDLGSNPNGYTLKGSAQAYVNSGGGDGTWFELFVPLQGGDQGTPVKAGDYENTGIVNAADYVTYRNSIGGTIPFNETVSPGVVDAADYDEWRARFGTNYTFITTIIDNVRLANAGSGAGGAVPEPASASFVMFAFLFVGLSRRLRK